MDEGSEGIERIDRKGAEEKTVDIVQKVAAGNIAERGGNEEYRKLERIEWEGLCRAGATVWWVG